MKRLFRFLASYALSIVLLLFLLLLTFLGTIGQVDRGLYAIQKEYFESVFLVHWFFGVLPVPLPGVYLLLVLFTINLTCGAVLRARKRWNEAGILVAHLGVLLLLVGSFVTYTYSVRGNLTLNEGEQSDQFESAHTWEIRITKMNDMSAKTLVIPGADFESPKVTTFHAASLPFELTISGYMQNAELIQQSETPNTPAKSAAEDLLHQLPPAADAESNIPALQAAAKSTADGKIQEGILSGMASAPWRVTIGADAYAVELRRQAWPLPFTIRLDHFIHEVHPGTSSPKAFISEVTRIEGASEQQVRISMNAPMRYKGYAFYQSSWGSDQKSGRVSSVLAVVRNPADKFPLYACCVVSAGLLVHFALKLLAYLLAQTRRRAA